MILPADSNGLPENAEDVSVEEPSRKSGEELILALKTDNISLIKGWLQSDKNFINSSYYPYGSPLVTAGAFGSVEAIDLLLKHGTDINQMNDRRYTALLYAAGFDRHDIADFLIDQGADIHAKNDRGWTPLHFACNNGDIKLAEKLIKLGANLQDEDFKQRTPLDFMRDNNPDCFKKHATALEEIHSDEILARNIKKLDRILKRKNPKP